jgi:hypothetical protein
MWHRQKKIELLRRAGWRQKRAFGVRSRQVGICCRTLGDGAMQYRPELAGHIAPRPVLYVVLFTTPIVSPDAREHVKVLLARVLAQPR